MDPLTAFLEETSAASVLRVESDYGDGFVRLRSDEAERRQAAQDIRSSEDIVIEMLRNARDAHARVIFLATGVSDGERTITVIDDGDGIPAHMHELIFEPRVTSKLDTAHHDRWGMHGRGMALYSVRVNAQSARVVVSRPSCGSSLQVVTKLSALGEKADQSTFPRFTLDADSRIEVRGPKNILRTCCEFAFEERNTLSLYVGTAAEIAAALYEYGSAHVPLSLRAFSDAGKDEPYVNRPAFLADAASLGAELRSLGLAVSDRTAQRILNAEIEAPQPLLMRIAEGLSRDAQPAKHTLRTSAKQAHVSLSHDDVQAVKQAFSQDFKEIAHKYYLDENVEPHVQVRKGFLTVAIPLHQRDL